MIKYHELLKIVNPKRIAVKEMTDKLKIVRAGLAEKRAKLKAVEEKLAKLQAMYDEKKALEASL